MWSCCPFHTEKTPSFKVEDGWFHCFGCGANGDSIEWLRLMERCSFKKAVEALAGDCISLSSHSLALRRMRKTDDTTRKIREARAIWMSATPIGHTKGADYLRARGIQQFNSPSLRYIDQFHREPGCFPALVAAIATPNREVCGVQVTLLADSGMCKAEVAVPRKTYGVLADGAVRLAPATDVLGIAEGVETALSAMLMTGIPVWACLGAARMHRVGIPGTVRHLHLFGDDDEPGRNAVQATVKGHPNLRRIVRMPPEGFGDWNDALFARAEGALFEIPQVPA